MQAASDPLARVLDVVERQNRGRRHGLDRTGCLCLGTEPAPLRDSGCATLPEGAPAPPLGEKFSPRAPRAAASQRPLRACCDRVRVNDELVFRFADVVLDEGAHEVRRAGHVVDLTPTEYRLLRFFLTHPRRVVTREQILEGVWGDSRVEPGEVETYVSYLRRKLDPLGPPLIQTIRSFGYALRPPS